MKRSIILTSKEVFYFCALFIYTFAGDVIANSYLFGQAQSRFAFSNFFQYLGAIFFFIAFCLSGHLTIKSLTVRMGFGLLTLLIAYNMHSISFGVNILAILAALNIDFRRIVKWCVEINLLNVLIVISSSLIGLITDGTTIHNGMVAHYLGFAYYSNAPYVILMLTIMWYWLLQSRKTENLFLILSIPIHFIIYKVCTVRLVLYIYVLFVILVLLSRKIRPEKSHPLLSLLSIIMYPSVTFLTVYASYKSQTSELFSAMDRKLNGRLTFNVQGFQQYGIKAFGQKIITSQQYIDSNYVNHYFFIDCGYAYMLICYGILFSFILIAGYCYLSWNTIKKKDYKMFVWCVVCCLFSVINNVLFSVTLNPLPILSCNLFFNNVINRRAKTINYVS